METPQQPPEPSQAPGATPGNPWTREDVQQVSQFVHRLHHIDQLLQLVLNAKGSDGYITIKRRARTAIIALRATELEFQQFASMAVIRFLNSPADDVTDAAPR